MGSTRVVQSWSSASRADRVLDSGQAPLRCAWRNPRQCSVQVVKYAMKPLSLKGSLWNPGQLEWSILTWSLGVY